MPLTSSWKKLVSHTFVREHQKTSSDVEDDATPSEPQGSVLGGAHGGIVPPIGGAATVPQPGGDYVPQPPPPADGAMGMFAPVGGSLGLSPSYVAHPPLPSSAQGLAQNSREVDRLADKLKNTTKALEDALVEIVELKGRVQTLERDLAVAQCQKYKAAALSVRLKVSLQPFLV